MHIKDTLPWFEIALIMLIFSGTGFTFWTGVFPFGEYFCLSIHRFEFQFHHPRKYLRLPFWPVSWCQKFMFRTTTLFRWYARFTDFERCPQRLKYSPTIHRHVDSKQWLDVQFYSLTSPERKRKFQLIRTMIYQITFICASSCGDKWRQLLTGRPPLFTFSVVEVHFLNEK